MYSKTTLYTFLSCFIFVLGGCTSQKRTAELVIHTNEQPFFLKINGKQVNYTPTRSICVQNLTPKYPYRLQLNFLDSKKKEREKVILKNRRQSIYQIKKVRLFGYEMTKDKSIPLKKITERENVVDFLNIQVPPADTAQPTAIQNSCLEAMNDADFTKGEQLMSQQTDDKQRLRIVRQMLLSNCLSTSQVLQLATHFELEKNKLKLFEIAFSKTTDRHRYYLLNQSLSSQRGQKQFDIFLKEQNNE